MAHQMNGKLAKSNNTHEFIDRQHQQLRHLCAHLQRHQLEQSAQRAGGKRLLIANKQIERREMVANQVDNRVAPFDLQSLCQRGTEFVLEILKLVHVDGQC